MHSVASVSDGVQSSKEKHPRNMNDKGIHFIKEEMKKQIRVASDRLNVSTGTALSGLHLWEEYGGFTGFVLHWLSFFFFF